MDDTTKTGGTAVADRPATTEAEPTDARRSPAMLSRVDRAMARRQPGAKADEFVVGSEDDAEARRIESDQAKPAGDKRPELETGKREEPAAGADGTKPKADESAATGEADPTQAALDYYRGLATEAGAVTDPNAAKPETQLTDDAAPFLGINERITAIGDQETVDALVALGYTQQEAALLVNSPKGAGKLAQDLGNVRKQATQQQKAFEAVKDVLVWDEKAGDFTQFRPSKLFGMALEKFGEKAIQDELAANTPYMLVDREMLKEALAANGIGTGDSHKLMRETAKKHKAVLQQFLGEGVTLDDNAIDAMAAGDLSRLVAMDADVNRAYLRADLAAENEWKAADAQRQTASQERLAGVERGLAARFGALQKKAGDRWTNLEPLIARDTKALFDGRGNFVPEKLADLLYHAAHGQRIGADLPGLLQTHAAYVEKQLLKKWGLTPEDLEARAPVTARRDVNPRASGFDPTDGG